MPVVAVGPDEWAIDGYSLPGTSTYEVKPWNNYYCSRDEAEGAGFFPNQFSDEGQHRLQELERQGNHPH